MNKHYRTVIEARHGYLFIHNIPNISITLVKKTTKVGPTKLPRLIAKIIQTLTKLITKLSTGSLYTAGNSSFVKFRPVARFPRAEGG